VKLHFAVNVEIHEVVAMTISTDDTHDVKALPGMVHEAEGNVRVAKLYGDGAYASREVYGLLEAKGVEVGAKPRRNSRLDAGLSSMRQVVIRSGASATMSGLGSPATVGGGRWRRLTRR
jgi:hypothetical protein